MYCFGDVGKGQEVKAINQILVAGSYVAVAEAIALGQALGLQMGTVVNALKTGAANSWALCNRSESMLNNKYPLGFKLSSNFVGTISEAALIIIESNKIPPPQLSNPFPNL